MSSLSIPTHVARQVAAQKRAQVSAPVPLPPMPYQARATVRVHEIDAPIPEGVPEPGQWRVLLFPVGQVKKTKGNIILPDQEIDLQDWTHMLWKVAKVGPLVYRGPAWAGFSEEELAPLRPKPGDLYLVDPKQPRRFHYTSPEGVKMLFIVVNDDQLWSRVDPASVERLEFRGLEL